MTFKLKSNQSKNIEIHIDILKGLEYWLMSLNQCPPCIKGKQDRVKFLKDWAIIAKYILEIIHSDIFYPFQTHWILHLLFNLHTWQIKIHHELSMKHKS